MTDAAPELLAYYSQGKERDRLLVGVGAVEFARTVEVVSRTLPQKPAVIADIGGGPGAYTDWLCEQGYTVVHRDVVDGHVEQVRNRHGAGVDTAVGDARDLDLPSNSVDAVLLLGPLYHLAKSIDRVTVLQEARRVVRSGGPIYAAAISRWAPRLQGILVNRIDERYPSILDLIGDMERTGWMDALEPGGFNGFAHTPDQLRAEVDAAGLEVEALLAIEGLSFALPNLDEVMADRQQRKRLLDSLRALEDEPSLLGLGPHILAVARKPQPSASRPKDPPP